MKALEPVIEPDVEETRTVVSSEWQQLWWLSKKSRRFGVQLMAVSEESSPSPAGSL